MLHVFASIIMSLEGFTAGVNDNPEQPLGENENIGNLHNWILKGVINYSFQPKYLMNTQKITTHLWFDHQAEEAANFYVSVFGENSGIDDKTYYSEAGQDTHGMEEGTLMTVDFHLHGQSFIALNGGPHFTFNEAISLMITCEDQEEIDHFWEKLSADPKAEQCGWLKDKFGVSWQVVPEGMNEMLTDEDPEKAKRAMNAMLQMKKLDIQKLQEAFEDN